mgnify:CR=1 FL=1
MSVNPAPSRLPLKGLIVPLLALAVFAAADAWVWRTLEIAYTGARDGRIRGTVASIAASVPASQEERIAWGKRLSGAERDFDAAVTEGFPEAGKPSGSASIVSTDPSLASLMTAPIPDVAKGIESVGYDEPYRFTHRPTDGSPERIFVFAPLHGAAGDVTGVALFAFRTDGSDRFVFLLRLFALLATAAFAAVLAIARFSRDPALTAVVLTLFVIVGVFTAYPLYEAGRLTLVRADGSFTWDVWKSVFTEGRYMAALRGSILLGALTATASTLLGFLFAFVVGRTTIGCKRLLTAAATMPVISPPFSLTLSVILLFGNNGLVTKQLLGLHDVSVYGLTGLVLVQTMGMFPIAFLTLAGILEGIDSTLEEAAMDLGASRLRTFRTVTLPLAVPGLLSAWLLVFTNSLADFANPLILAGDFHVLSVEAYIEVTGMNRLGTGAALSILLLLPTLTAFTAQRRWVARKSFVTVTGKPSARITEIVSPGVRRILAIAVWGVVIFLAALYGTIIAGCFVKNWGVDYSFSLVNIREAFERGRDALIDTVTLAAMATPIAGVLSMVAAAILTRRAFAFKRLLEYGIMTPFALPGTLMGISYILAFNKPPVLLVGTAAIIVINYVIRELPVGVEGGVAALRQIDPSIEEAAQNLGADAPRVFRDIILPLLRPAFISSLSYTFVRSMTAVSAVIFLISARWYHVTVLIYNFSENLRFGLASVLATALIVIVLAAMGLMRLLVGRNRNLDKTLLSR